MGNKVELGSNINYIVDPPRELLSLHEMYHLSSQYLPEVNLNTLSHQIRSEKLALLAGLLSTKHYGLSYMPQDLTQIQYGMRYHDCLKGRLDIIRYVVGHGILDEEEKKATYNHAWIGYESLIKAGMPDEVAYFARNHHQRPDNKGYPDKVIFGQLPQSFSRLLSFSVNGSMAVDVFDAMRSWRDYRAEDPVYGKRCSIEDVRDALNEQKGRLFYGPMAELILSYLPLLVELQDILHSFHREYELRQMPNRIVENVIIRRLGSKSLEDVAYLGAHYLAEPHLMARSDRITELFLIENLSG